MVCVVLFFDWGHSYGPISWPRDGSEVLRVAARDPAYWKVRNLDDFDGATWIDSEASFSASASPEFDLAREWRSQAGWRERLRVTLRRIETRDVIGAGTTLGVADTARTVAPSGDPGLWRSETVFRGGDSYSVSAFVPQPTASDLGDSGSGADSRRRGDLDLVVPTDADADSPVGDAATAGLRSRRHLRVELNFAPFEPLGRGPEPYADYRTLTRSHDGDAALRASPYERTWRLSRQLARQSDTPYEYVLAVNRFLQNGFTYAEVPEPVPFGVATLDGFLFDTRSGYCQHFSGAMAILLRMGGIPARVATGFSPGGYSKRKQAWIVRDTDAHSWVEAWFDDWGWVAFDPTPAGTPARSQIAALERPPETSSDRGDAAASDEGGSTATPGGVRPDLLGGQPAAGGAAADANDDRSVSWWWGVPGALLLVGLAAWIVLRRRRRREGPAAALDRAVRELEAALRRSGRPARTGTTLHQLEQRLGRTPEAAAYLRALRAGRFAPTAAPPTAGGRRALRRELASGGGPRGRARALWALPPWRG